MKTTPEQRAEWKHKAETLVFFTNPKMVLDLIADLEEAQAKLSAAEKDAARYRWMRDNYMHVKVVHRTELDTDSELVSKDDVIGDKKAADKLDCLIDKLLVIDAARAAQEQQP